jgi:hypothetical protein
MSLVTVERVIARRLPSRDQAKDRGPLGVAGGRQLSDLQIRKRGRCRRVTVRIRGGLSSEGRDHNGGYGKRNGACGERPRRFDRRTGVPHRPASRGSRDQLARVESGFQFLEVVPEVPRILIPTLGILGKRAADDAVQFGRSAGLISVTNFGVSFSTDETIDMLVSPVNGRWPVAISYRITPREKRSVRASTGRPSACSGDM